MSIELQSGTNSELRLFNYSGQRRRAVAETIVGMTRTSSMLLRSTSALLSFRIEARSHYSQLGQTESELNEQAAALESSISTTLYYLEFSRELEQYGADPESIFVVFGACLRVNTKIHEQMRKKRLPKNTSGKIVSAVSSVAESIFAQEFNKLTIPSWFKGGKRDWDAFLYIRLTFRNYFRDKGIGIEEDLKLGYTAAGCYPDWYTDSLGLPLDREVVEREMAEDRTDLEKLVSQLKIIHNKKVYLDQLIYEKGKKVESWIDEADLSLQQKVGDLPTLLVRLAARDALFKRRGLTREEAEVIKRQEGIKRPVEDILNPVAYEIRYFSRNTSISLSSEFVALWFTERLRAAGLISSVNDPLSSETAHLITQTLVSTEEGKCFWRGMRDIDKKKYDLFIYTLRPLLLSLSSETASFILEFAQEARGASIEHFIWALADAIEQHKEDIFAKAQNGQVNGLAPCFDDLSKFTARWLTKNWQWAYNLLLSQLKPSVPIEIEQNLAIGVPEVSENVGDYQVIEDIEKEVVEMQKGPLEGWRIYYLQNLRNPDRKYWTEIKGETVAQREKALEEYIRENGVSCTVKPATIIRVLESIVTTPGSIEHVRMRLEAGDEVYKKRKRRNMRILYRVDQVEKVLLFNLYKKEDMSYRKL